MRNYFRGLYFKCQNETQTAAFIPAYHIRDNVKTCSLQIITDEGAWNVDYPIRQFRMDDNCVKIGPNLFSRQGFRLDVRTEKLTVQGGLRFGPLAPIAYDIMGPFKYVPFLECRHSVFSMKHQVDGRLTINGKEYSFLNGVGYLEGDRGRSFPRDYLWTQCCFRSGSIMLSVADIPFCGVHFTGIIGVIHFRGKEYRLATYLGARAVKIRDGEAVIRQGSKTLTVRRLEDKGHPLAAPVGGAMKRTIRESAACKASYHFREKGKTIFEFTSSMASFEYEYPQ
ncbi:MAG: hypothetical protein IKK72_04380 [Oscillospiraceae bacterium]|nr:hypothetical protein [Oscillospiraceae bacterium]